VTEVAICIILVLLNTAVSLKYKEQIISTSTTRGAVTAYTSRAHEFTPGFKWGSCYSFFSFICMFCRSLFVLLSFFFWPLCCLLFFDLRIMITPLVSSKSSYLNLSVYIEYNLSTIVFRYCRDWTKLFRGFHYIYFILNYNFSANYPEVNSYRILIIVSF
jgi:hypothetical protein